MRCKKKGLGSSLVKKGLLGFYLNCMEEADSSKWPLSETQTAQDRTFLLVPVSRSTE
jgi:hypothetical protein